MLTSDTHWNAHIITPLQLKKANNMRLNDFTGNSSIRTHPKEPVVHVKIK